MPVWRELLSCHFWLSREPRHEGMTLFSANIGPIQANHDWKSWQSHLMSPVSKRLESVRITNTQPNLPSVMPDTRRSLVDSYRVSFNPRARSCGGVEILDRPRCCSLFKNLFKNMRTKRVFFMPRRSPLRGSRPHHRKVLLCSVYAATGPTHS